MKLLNFFILLIIFFINSIILKSQNDNNKKDTIVYYQISDFYDKGENDGYDSIGRKQGFWSEEFTYGDYIIFFRDSSYLKDDLIGYGYYVDNKKEGFWDIFKKTGVNEVLISQFYYVKDTLIFQISYNNKQISQISFIINIIPKNYKSGYVYAKDKIVFNKKGIIDYRESYAPYQILEKFKYKR